MRERISYYSDGLKLSGILSTPDNSGKGPFPGVVLVPGFMSTADAFFPGFADEFTAAGFVSLTMDFRGFGESEGVRGEVIPWSLDFLGQQRKVWTEKGGEVIALSAAEHAELMAKMAPIGDDIVKTKPELKPLWDQLVATAKRSM